MRNLLENLVYIVVVGTIIVVNNYMVIGRFEGMVNTAIAKESTAIHHSFQTQISKLKAKRGELDFTVSPKLNSKITNNDLGDTLRPATKKQKGFLKRLFGGKN